MVLSGLCGCANAPLAAVRAKFQGEFLDSSVDLGVDRLALLRSWVPGLIALDEVTRQPVFSDAAQEVMVRYSSDLPTIGSIMAPGPIFALSESVHTEVSRIMHIWDCDVLGGISSEFCHQEVGSDSIAVASGSRASFRGDDQSFPIVRAGERLSGMRSLILMVVSFTPRWSTLRPLYFFQINQWRWRTHIPFRLCECHAIAIYIRFRRTIVPRMTCFLVAS